MIPYASLAQPAFIPVAPGSFGPGFTGAGADYKLQQEVQCPTPTFNVTGFGGNLSGWGDTHYEPFQSTSAGLGTYGIAAGVSIPLGNDLQKFCKRYAEIKREFEQTRLRNQAINSQFALYKHCRYFRDVGYNLNDPRWFDEKGPLSAFSGCKALAEFLDPDSAKRPTISNYPPDPKPANTQPSTLPATPVSNVN